MQSYEYRYAHIESDEFEKLENLGLVGWEVICKEGEYQTHSTSPSMTTVYLLKRPLSSSGEELLKAKKLEKFAKEFKERRFGENEYSSTEDNLASAICGLREYRDALDEAFGLKEKDDD